jgi:hypothetical protein
MKKINARFMQEGDKLLAVLDPAQITSLAHSKEVLRDLIAQWIRERRDRGLVTYGPLPPAED